MKVWVVPFAYEERPGLVALQGVEVFNTYEKAKQFLHFLKEEHTDKKGLDLFIQEKEIEIVE